jgi:hypothetical protein
MMMMMIMKMIIQAKINTQMTTMKKMEIQLIQNRKVEIEKKER